MLVEDIAKLGSPARNAASASLILIAVLAMYKWTVTPQTAYLSAAKGLESTIDRVMEQNKSITKQIELKRRELKALREDSAQLRSILFTPNQAKEFFSDLQAISEQAGCAVYSINLTTGKQRPEHDRLGIVANSMALSVVGVYKDIGKLIERLQTRTQNVWIDSVRMRTLDSSSDKVICDLSATILQITDKDTP